MVRPARRLMRSPTAAFWIIGVVMYIAALFIWPSPATALVGTILFPAGLAVGLPAISIAMSMNLFGHGVCLATDYVIQGAPKLTAEAAGVPVSDILAASTPLNIAASVVALTVAWFFVVRKDIKAHTVTETEYLKFEEEAAVAESREYSQMAKVASWLVPLAFLVDVILLIMLEIRGGDATAVLGGTSGAPRHLLLLGERIQRRRRAGHQLSARRVNVRHEGLCTGVHRGRLLPDGCARAQ